MNSDLAIDEAKAAAQPWDWAEDFGRVNGHCLSCCQTCLRTFLGHIARGLCRRCDPDIKEK